MGYISNDSQTVDKSEKLKTDHLNRAQRRAMGGQIRRVMRRSRRRTLRRLREKHP